MTLVALGLSDRSGRALWRTAPLVGPRSVVEPVEQVVNSVTTVVTAGVRQCSPVSAGDLLSTTCGDQAVWARCRMADAGVTTSV